MSEQEIKETQDESLRPETAANKPETRPASCIALLKDIIKSLHETDPGDFKRKAVLYLGRFADVQEWMPDVKKAEALKQDVLCKEFSSPDKTENVENLRAFILERLKDF